ncbi:ankyrin-2 isoform X1 [Pungitius pungitius]|uniref:ankyrin-2 isoform X1 n=1 Tax=Pungitius pungitius TaxID=134920 RepID=UPI002E103538
MGHLNIVLLLLQSGASPDVRNIRGETALHMAARAGQMEVVRCLLRNGALVDAIAREDQTPLHISSRLGKTDIVQLLLQHMAHPDASTTNGYTPLHISAREGQVETAAVLLEAGASHSLATKKGFTPLHVAAKYGSLDVAKLLLQRKALPDDAGKNGLTPLHVAAHYDNQEVALLLLDKGASPFATAKNGYTPLHIAAKKNQTNIASALLQYGAETNVLTKQGVSPLHLAAQEGHAEMAGLLLGKGAHANTATKTGLTPLHLAAQEDRVSAAEVLAKHDANLDQQTKLGYTPLIVACHYGNAKMVNFLLQHGASVNAKTKNGYTPLHQAAQQGNTHIINMLLQHGAKPNATTVNGNTALSIAKRLGYISVVDTLKVVTEEVITTTTTVTEKHKLNVPETMTEILDVSDEEGEDTMTGDGGEYLRAEDLRELGDDSLPGHYLDSFSYMSHNLDRPQLTPIHQSFCQKDGVLIEDMLTSHQVSSLSREHDKDSFRLSWGAEHLDNVVLSSSLLHSGRSSPCLDHDNSSFLVSFMVDARGGAMRGCRHNGLRIIVPPRKCSAPTRVTCRLVKRHRLASMPPMVEGEGLAGRIIEVGPTGAQFLGKLHLPTAPPPLNEGESLVSRILQLGPPGTKFLGPVIVEIPHFAALRGTERELVILRSETGESWREHHCDFTEEELNQILNGMDEKLDSPEELEKKRICRIITRDFPQYFAVVSRIKQDSHLIGPEGGVLSSTLVPQVQAVFPEGALTKKIRVGLQAQPIEVEVVRKILGNKATFSSIVTLEPRRRKFHKPITMTLPIPKSSNSDGQSGVYSGGTPTLRLLCSITGGTTPAQWEDITGSTPLTFVNQCVSFTTNVSARFWLIDCRQIQESVSFGSQLYREIICVPYMAKFVIFAKTLDPIEARLRCFCMTDDKMDKTLEQQENFTEVARSRDVEVLEGKPIFADCFGNLVPLTKSGQHHVFSFFAFKENRLALFIKIRDTAQEPCGRLSFTKEPRTYRTLNHNAICNLNITLPTYSKESDSDQDADDESERSDKKYDESESTETFSLRNNQPLDPATLASPDLLSDISDVRSSAIPTAEQMEPSLYDERAGATGLEEKAHSAIVFKDRLEKVEGIQRGSMDERRQEQGRVQRHDATREKRSFEIKSPSVQEPCLQEICNEGKTSSRSATEVREMSERLSHLSIDMDQYLESSVVTFGSLEDLVQDTFEPVIVKLDEKRRPPDIKKPIRKKLRDRERSGCSSSEGELERMSSEESLDGEVVLKESGLLTTTVMDPPASPSVVETPIGSIKERLRALENKVEEEGVNKDTQERIPQAKYSIAKKKNEADMPELPRVPTPPKSPGSQTERLEETMSVKELMNAFQTGQDPSKSKAGLFEHKAVAPSGISTLISESGDSDESQMTEQSPTHEANSQTQTQKLTSLYRESDINKLDETDLGDQPERFITDNSEESQFTSRSVSFGKRVKFADAIQCDDGIVSPQVPEKETMSVKELMKAFGNGHDPSKTKAGVSPHISTLISVSGDCEEMNTSNQNAPQEPKHPIPTQNLTLFPSSDVKKCVQTDTEDQPLSFRDSSKKSPLVSGSAPFGKMVTFADGVQCDDSGLTSVSPQGETSELSEKETLSVKELLKAFQSGHDPSKTKAGLYEHKAGASSCISTLISESGDSGEIKTTKQGVAQTPKSQIQNLTSFQQQSDGKERYTTDLRDQPVSLSRDNSEELQFISDFSYLGKTVTFADTIQCDSGSQGSELSQKDTTSVKELMKAFQTGQEPFKTKVGLVEHKASASSSTMISESLGPQEIQMTQHSPTLEHTPQSLTHNVTIFHPQSDIDIDGTLDLGSETVNLMRDNSEELQLISDISYFGETIEIDDTIQFDDVTGSPEREDPDFSGESRGRMHLEEPVMSIGRSLSEDLQISPNRRPSEDFSADIKAELEDSPEYQLFKQTSTAEEISNQLEAPEGETVSDSDPKPASISSSCVKSYIGETYFPEDKMKDDDLSPESPKHEGMAESSNTNVHLKNSRSSSEESGNHKGLTVTHQVKNEMYTYSSERKENLAIQDESLHEANKESLTPDHGSKMFFSQTDTELTVVKIGEPQLHEVHIERNTSIQASTAEKDISGMLSLLSSELDQYLKSRPVARQPTGEDVVLEKFKQTILTRERRVTDENEATTVTTKETNHALTEEHPITRGSEEIENEIEEVSNTPEFLSINDWNQYEEPLPLDTRPFEDVNGQDQFDMLASFADENRGVTANCTLQETDKGAVDCHVTQRGEVIVGEFQETNATLIEELPMNEERVEREASYEPSGKVKDISGMPSVLNSDLHGYLKDRPVKITPPEENVIQDKFEEVHLSKIHPEKDDLFLEDYQQARLTSDLENKVDVEAKEHLQADRNRITGLSPSSDLETPFQEVFLERKTQQQPSAAKRDMSGMASLLSSDLNEYLNENPVAIQLQPEEDLVHESCREVFLTSSNVEDKIGLDANEPLQTNAVAVPKLSISSVLETPFQEVCMERKTQQQQSATERDMTGMLSLLSGDLNQYLTEKPMAIQSHPEEDLVQESCKQLIFTSSNWNDKMGGEVNEHVQTDIVGATELSPSSVLETPFQEVCMERKTQQQQSATERDMTGILSLLSGDLDQRLEEMPMQCHPEQDDLVLEGYQHTGQTRCDLENKVDVEAKEHFPPDRNTITELSPSSDLETPFQEVSLERKTQQQQSAAKRDMSGMASLLCSDLNEYLTENPVAIQLQPEEDLVRESCKEVFLTSSNLEDKIGLDANEPLQTNAVAVPKLSISSVLETPFQEVCMERKTQQQQSATERDMTGMLSLLSGDLNQYLTEKPMAIQSHPEEDLVQESCKQVILTSSNWDDKMGGEANEHVQTDIVGATELSPSSVLETPFQEVCIERKAQQQQSATERDMTGMLSLLSSDLNRYLTEKPVVMGCQSKEEEVYEHFEEVILPKDTERETLSFSPEHEIMSPDQTADFVNPDNEGALESGWKTTSHEDERPKSLSSEEDEAKNSPRSHFSDSTEVEVGITTSFVTTDDSNNDQKDVVAESILKKNDFWQITNRSDTLQRPDSLGNLNTVLSGDPAEDLCQQDSLETSPQKDDGSSYKSPDSIEPSPTGECPSPDSLEGSPTQSKDAEPKTPAKTAVYEDYASQLKACYASDKNLYRDEIEKEDQEEREEREGQEDQEERENAYGIVQMEGKMKDLHSYSAQMETDGSTYSGTKIYDSENLQLLVRQDSLDEDDIEDEAANKQFTPEEEMFKMAAKIQTYDEMEQEAKVKRDKSETGALRNEEADQKRFTQLDAEKLCPAKDRNPPDKTHDQTPGHERTADPFQFQEGKLFEMTRGGAIDMTRRSFDEGEGYAFFHIDEHAVDEVVPEEPEECKTKYLALENSDHISDATLEEMPESDLTHGENDTIPTPKPRSLIRPSNDTPERNMLLPEADLGSSTDVDPCSPGALERLTNNQSECGNLERFGLGYLDSTIADLHSAYSERSHDSSDSSPEEEEEEEEDEEDQCSVIEMSLAEAGISAYHQDPPTALGMTVKDSPKSLPNQVKRTAEKRSTLDRRTRSETDSSPNKALNKDCRSHSDSSEPTDDTTKQQKPQAQAISASSPQRKEIQLTETTETSVRSSLDADYMSSASQSPDSVIPAYDIAVSHSTDSEVNPLPGVQPSSGREDVFQTSPAWDATVDTQMQRAFDEPASDCTPDWQDDADRKEETLAIVADLLGFSWTELARELEFSEIDIQLVRTENPNSLQEQSHALLQRWVEREGKHATEDCLIKRLTKINRMDIVHLIETQMNKSVQEQTSRTYAEIEKTLDHSEVSVALSLVQDDADSPRVVRRVESDRRPPPAVSEEDLSVASLLDIPSWAEPVGHTHSESMHGDLMEELEIPHELNPNMWTSEDVITEETASYDNLDEQADEMPDLSTQSVTEEKYQDENGHVVVKKVTRTVLRTCVSADGVERAASSEGAPRASVRAAAAGGHSDAVKRTVLKSEGDHTQGTFSACEDFSASGRATAESCRVSGVERTKVVEGERTKTQQGDPSLASDLPFAQKDFKQGPHA